MTDDQFPYPTEGLHRILAWSSDGPSIVVARVTLSGRPWGRFIRKIGRPGWHAVCSRTLAEALK